MVDLSQITNNPAYTKQVVNGVTYYIKKGKYIDVNQSPAVTDAKGRTTREPIEYVEHKVGVRPDGSVTEFKQEAVPYPHGKWDKLVTTLDTSYKAGQVTGVQQQFEYDPEARGGKGGVVKTKVIKYQDGKAKAFDLVTASERKALQEQAEQQAIKAQQANRPPVFTKGSYTITRPPTETGFKAYDPSAIYINIDQLGELRPQMESVAARRQKELRTMGFSGRMYESLIEKQEKSQRDKIKDVDIGILEEYTYVTGKEPKLKVGKQEVDVYDYIADVKQFQVDEKFKEGKAGKAAIAYEERAMEAKSSFAQYGLGTTAEMAGLIQRTIQEPVRTGVELGAIGAAFSVAPVTTGVVMTGLIGKGVYEEAKQKPLPVALGKATGAVLPFVVGGLVYGGLRGGKRAFDFMRDKPFEYEIKRLKGGRVADIKYSFEGEFAKDLQIQLGFVKETKMLRKSKLPKVQEEFLIGFEGTRLTQPTQKVLQTVTIEGVGMLKKGKKGEPIFDVVGGYGVKGMETTTTFGDFSLQPKGKIKPFKENVKVSNVVKDYQRMLIKDTMLPIREDIVWTESGKPLRGFGKTKVSQYPFVEPKMQKVKGYTRYYQKTFEITKPFGSKKLPQLPLIEQGMQGNIIKPTYTQELFFKPITKKKFKQQLPKTEFQKVFPERRGRKAQVKPSSLIYGADPLTAVALELRRFKPFEKTTPKPKAGKPSDIYSLKRVEPFFRSKEVVKLVGVPKPFVKTKPTIASRRIREGKEIYDIFPKERYKRKKTIFDITGFETDVERKTKIKPITKVDTLLVPRQKIKVSQRTDFFDFPERPYIPPPPPSKPPLPRKESLPKKKKKVKKKMDLKAGRYAPTLYGLDLYKEFGYTEKAEPLVAGAGLRLPTKKQAKQLQKGWMFSR